MEGGSVCNERVKSRLTTILSRITSEFILIHRKRACDWRTTSRGPITYRRIRSWRSWTAARTVWLEMNSWGTTRINQRIGSWATPLAAKWIVNDDASPWRYELINWYMIHSTAAKENVSRREKCCNCKLSGFFYAVYSRFLRMRLKDWDRGRKLFYAVNVESIVTLVYSFRAT